MQTTDTVSDDPRPFAVEAATARRGIDQAKVRHVSLPSPAKASRWMMRKQVASTTKPA
jgi:hypothetical protein